MPSVSELFLLSLDERGEGFEHAAVRSILARGAVKSERPGRWTYADGSGADVHGLDLRGRLRGPHLLFTEFGGATMLSRLYEIVAQLEVVLFWPQTQPHVANACVGRAERAVKLGGALRSVLRLEIVRDATHLATLLDASPRPAACPQYRR